MRDRDDAGRRRERAEAERLRERAERLRRQEARGYGHAFVEHRDVTDAQLERRARDGTTARGERRPAPAHATRWQSDAALVRAAETLWRSDEALRKRKDAEAEVARGRPARVVAVSARMPLTDVLGPGYRSQVYGRTNASGGRSQSRFSDASTAFAYWRMNDNKRWYLVTCYPEP